MPHLFVNRPRLHALRSDIRDTRTQFRWETVNAVLYEIGGVVFILGSVLFFPALERYADLGAWIFFIGSLIYLVVTVHDLAEVCYYWRVTADHGGATILEFVAATSYVTGTLLFAAGSVFFLSVVGWQTAGAWCFVVGSLLFVVGACINVLQIVSARSLVTLQLMNLTAVAFVVGSVLFTVASVPYLWNVGAPSLENTLYGYVAWQYLIGSILFLTGGAFNYLRASLVCREVGSPRRDA